MLMRKMEFICPKCGTEFTVEADHFMPGVEGFCNDLKFVDPTTPRHCPRCAEEMIKEMISELVGDG